MISLSVPVIGFSSETYTVTEGTPTVDLVVSVTTVTLGKTIDVILTLNDGTATCKNYIVSINPSPVFFVPQPFQQWTIMTQTSQ